MSPGSVSFNLPIEELNVQGAERFIQIAPGLIQIQKVLVKATQRTIAGARLGDKPEFFFKS